MSFSARREVGIMPLKVIRDSGMGTPKGSQGCGLCG